MFALEIDFHDGISPPETILVRRSNAIVGSSELAHVVIDGAATSHCELRLVRGLGREFSCFPVKRPGHSTTPPPFLEGTYLSETELKLGELTFHITALDIDTMLLPDEFPDKGALRVLKGALSNPSPLFPAIAVLGTKPIFLSFPTDEVLLVGRSRRCGLRLDAPDVSSEHARIGIEGGKAWVEDLGSTNGTMVNDTKVSGRKYLGANDRVNIGSEFILVPVLGVGDISNVNSLGDDRIEPPEARRYPCIVGSGAEIRPGRLVIREGESVSIGRDPASDMWINAAHISRNHVVIFCGPGLSLGVTDHSSNGTYFDDERLPRGSLVPLPKNRNELDLCEGVRLNICLSEQDELELEDSIEQKSPEDESEQISRSSSPAIEQIRQLHERDISDVNPAKNSSAFQKFAEKQRKQAYSSNEVASDYIDPVASESNFFGSSDLDVSQSGYSDSGRTAVPGSLDLNTVAPEEVSFFESEVLDEELLRTPYYKGVRRLLFGTLIAAVVIFVLVLFIGIFTDSQFY